MNINNPTARQIPALRTLWKEAFDDDDTILDSFFGTAFSCERSRCITENGRIAAALYWFDCLYKSGRVAYIYAVAAASEMRGKGLCPTLMEDTHRHLALLGYDGAILVPGEEWLFAFYEKMGYRTCGYVDEFTVFANGEKANISEIEKDEYARLRRLMLPEGGVIQENENLDFLETQAKLYKGDELLFAAEVRDGTLFVTEYLGKRAKASAVTAALGCRRLEFRTPGNTRPFAMYRPIGQSKTEPPSYFGLAFD